MDVRGLAGGLPSAEAVDAGVYLVDRSGRLLQVNSAALLLLGYAREEVLGRDTHDLWHFIDATGRRRAAATCPITSVAREGVPESWSGDVFVRRDGTLLPVSWMSLPLLEDGEPVGAMVVFHDLSGRRDELRADAEIPEARTVDAAAASDAARTAFLTDITLALISTLDVDDALGRLARIVVPRFADWCVVDLIDPDGMVRRVTVAHRIPGRVRDLGPDTVRFPLPDPPGPPLAQVLRGQSSVVVEDMASLPAPTTEMDANQRALFDRLGAREALVVGLQARTRTIGAVTLVREDSRHFTSAERALAEDIALRAGIAVDNARLYTASRSTAEALQRSLLPTLPATDHLILAATYVPAGRGAEVGGDWYDAFSLGEGITGVALGDVVGHDLMAATHMGELRTLLRASALGSSDPAAVLGELDRAMSLFVPGVTATAIFGRVAPRSIPGEGAGRVPSGRVPSGRVTPGRVTPGRVTSGRVTRGRGLEIEWSNAGHPPPLLLPADGAAVFLEADSDPLLGAAPWIRRQRHRTALDPGSMVVLYSDGLVEDRDTGLGPGMDRLLEVAARLAPEGPEALSRHLLPELGRESADDIAILVIGAPPA